MTDHGAWCTCRLCIKAERGEAAAQERRTQERENRRFEYMAVQSEREFQGWVAEEFSLPKIYGEWRTF